MSFLRVNKERRCPVCGHSDWCLVSKDGSAAICPRTESGAVRRLGGAGWLHRLVEVPRRRSEPRPIVIAAPVLATQDFREMADKFQHDATVLGRIKPLAEALGVSAESLRRLGVGWNDDERCWTFPMFDTCHRIVGINRRFQNGDKRIMPGHHAGLYLPSDLPADLAGESLLICEGGTDMAAALDLGCHAIGRFNSAGGQPLVVGLVRRANPEIVVIVADADSPGRAGAAALGRALRPRVPTVKVIEPLAGHKDLRAWRQAGANHTDLAELIEQADGLCLAVEVRS